VAVSLGQPAFRLINLGKHLMSSRTFSARLLCALWLFTLCTAAFWVVSSRAHGASILLGYLNSDQQYTATVLDSSKTGDYGQNPDGSAHWSGSDNIPGYLSLTWNFDVLDGDPQISGVVGLTNNSGFVNTFTIAVSQPLASAIPASVQNGSTAWTVTDGNSNGATLDAAVGDALYNAQIDGVTVRQLFPVGISPLALIAGADGSNTLTGNFSGELAPGAANSSIGIFHHFTLTPGDSASATSLYKITGVASPEPASITLSLLGLVGLGLACRQKQ
jgi:hypothetical protein